MSTSRRLLAATLAVACAPAFADAPAPTPPSRVLHHPCPDCAGWNAPRAPLRIAGNTWYVGVQGLSAVLITSPRGHVLIDGALEESAVRVAANIRKLGFRLQDVKYILSSHSHFDHAGGIKALADASGATVLASADGVAALARGGRDAPELDDASAFPVPPRLKAVRDGEVVRVGTIAVTAHYTRGHTPGSVSWTWDEKTPERTYHVAYVDSLTAPGYKLVDNDKYPDIVAAYRRTFDVVPALPCDILLTPHPSASQFDERLEKRNGDDAAAALATAPDCKAYAARARENFEKQLAEEQAAAAPKTAE